MLGRLWRRWREEVRHLAASGQEHLSGQCGVHIPTAHRLQRGLPMADTAVNPRARFDRYFNWNGERVPAN